MKSKFSEYISQWTKCYRDEYRNTDDIKVLCDLSEEVKDYKPELWEDAEYEAYRRGMLICQNPVVSEIVEEVTQDSKYAEYRNGKEKLKGYLLGQVIKKYPYCDLVAIGNSI